MIVVNKSKLIHGYEIWCTVAIPICAGCCGFFWNRNLFLHLATVSLPFSFVSEECSRFMIHRYLQPSTTSTLWKREGHCFMYAWTGVHRVWLERQCKFPSLMNKIKALHWRVAVYLLYKLPNYMKTQKISFN